MLLRCGGRTEIKMLKKIGSTMFFDNVYIKSASAVGGKKEGDGPLGKYFDKIFEDEYLGTKNFEQAETALQTNVILSALEKAKLSPKQADCIIAGDLLSQCTASSFCAKDFSVPFAGVYGACSTAALAMGIGSITIDGGFAENIISVTSSHFCSSERQFRYPLEYGNQRTPTAQWTVTAAGAAVLTNSPQKIRVKTFTIGKIRDLNITDANNMGAAMAPAAYDTIKCFLENTGAQIRDFDCIFTGDLGYIGSELLYELFDANGTDLRPFHNDCGKMIFARNKQDVHAGGSGCGCVGSVLCGYICPLLISGKLKRVAICATGALLSPVTALRGESIPSVAHIIELCAV